MKRLILTILILCTVVSAVFAQSTTTSFNVNGIKVIFKPTEKNIINVRIYFRGGVTNYPILKAGIENFALEGTTQCGTKNYSADAFRDTCDKYDISIFGKSTYDYGFIQLNCIKKYFDNGWDLFTDAVNDPVFDAIQTNMLKRKILATIRSNNANADNELQQLQFRNAFANTAYAVNPIGTEQTLNDITADDLKSYYNQLLNKDKMFIVVVGNITKEALYEKILSSFNYIKSSGYLPVTLNTPEWTDNKLLTQSQDVKVNYVSAIMNAPDFTSPDYVPFKLAVSGMLGNLYSYLRSTKGISFDPAGATVALRMPYCTMYASSNDPQQVMQAMLLVLKQVQNSGYDQEWLQHIKNIYVTSNYINEQSAADISASLGSAEILGNWQYADDFPQLVNMVTLEQVNRVINFYIKGMRWSYLGNTDTIAGFTPPGY